MDHVEYLDAAVDFMRRDHDTHPHAAAAARVRACSAFLCGKYLLSAATAGRISASALGECQSRRHRACIDIDHSTSHTIFMRDPGSGSVHAFTAAMLQALLTTHAIPIGSS